MLKERLCLESVVLEKTSVSDLVKDSEAELFRNKISYLKKQGAEELKQKTDDARGDDVKGICQQFAAPFCTLSHERLGLTLAQIKQLNAEDIKKVVKLLRPYANRRTLICKALIIPLLCIPIIGWGIIAEVLMNSAHWEFEKRLSKMGEDFPYEYLIEFLRRGGVSERMRGSQLRFERELFLV